MLIFIKYCLWYKLFPLLASASQQFEGWQKNCQKYVSQLYFLGRKFENMNNWGRKTSNYVLLAWLFHNLPAWNLKGLRSVQLFLAVEVKPQKCPCCRHRIRFIAFSKPLFLTLPLSISKVLQLSHSKYLQKMSEKTRVVEISGKGCGLVAAQTIHPGEIILEQPPMMLVDFKFTDEEARDR